MKLGRTGGRLAAAALAAVFLRGGDHGAENLIVSNQNITPSQAASPTPGKDLDEMPKPAAIVTTREEIRQAVDTKHLVQTEPSPHEPGPHEPGLPETTSTGFDFYSGNLPAFESFLTDIEKEMTGKTFRHSLLTRMRDLELPLEASDREDFYDENGRMRDHIKVRKEKFAALKEKASNTGLTPQLYDLYLAAADFKFELNALNIAPSGDPTILDGNGRIYGSMAWPVAQVYRVVVQGTKVDQDLLNVFLNASGITLIDFVEHLGAILEQGTIKDNEEAAVEALLSLLEE